MEPLNHVCSTLCGSPIAAEDTRLFACVSQLCGCSIPIGLYNTIETQTLYQTIKPVQNRNALPVAPMPLCRYTIAKAIVVILSINHNDDEVVVGAHVMWYFSHLSQPSAHHVSLSQNTDAPVDAKAP